MLSHAYGVFNPERRIAERMAWEAARPAPPTGRKADHGSSGPTERIVESLVQFKELGSWGIGI